MALQDLTPQLRTRLSRMERAVGWFVALATALLLFGFGYYIYKTAERKGWFKTRAPYFTLIDRATGLRVGDPVVLMGFDVGRITDVKPMPPADFQYNVYVEFEIIEPNYGYMWTVGSRAKVTTADLLGKRVLEVTKGTGGYPTYQFHPLRQVTVADARNLPEQNKWLTAEDIYVENTNGWDLVVPALTGVNTNLASIASLGRTNVLVLDTRKSETRKLMTAAWNDREGLYMTYTRASKPYWLPADETPAITERLEKLVGEIEKALPNVLGLTNGIITVLSNSVNLTSNLSALASDARPVATNLAYISAQLRESGSFGDWLLGTNAHHHLSATLENANTTVTHADTNLNALFENLARSLDNLAGITSNLNTQVQANTNIVGSISQAVVDADDLVQGLKRHWLLRSAFRSKTNAPPRSPTTAPRLTSPKDTSGP
jgi:ABC-type transporter Mla subunit MlaD